MDTTILHITRDENGLLTDTKYNFKDNNSRVDWFSMIPKEFIVPNKASFEKRKLPVPDSIEGLENKDLLILLEGFRYIAELRGFEEIEITNIHTTETRTTAVVKITWLPNFETQNRVVKTSSVGDATLESTRGFGFLGPISENRAFCRNVRAFLKIPVLGKDELDNNTKQEIQNSSSPASESNDAIVKKVHDLMKSKKIPFNIIKEKLVKESVPGASDFESVETMPKDVLFNIIERLQKIKVG